MLLGTVLLLFQAAFPFSGVEARVAASPKVILLLVDALAPAELADPAWSNVRLASGGGAVGLMSTRAAGPHTSPSAHLTIAAGARARAAALTGLTLAAYEQYGQARASDVFAALRGEPPAGAAALFLGAVQLASATPPLLLGPMLSEAGLRAAAIGNADTFAGGVHERRRFGALLAADADGLVAYGDVGDAVLMYDPEWPFGWRTDYDATWLALQSVYHQADFVVVELGDLARLDAYAEWIPSEHAQRLRRDTLQRIDQLVGRLLRWPPASGATLLLVSPSPPSDALQRGFMLAPLVAATLGPADAVGRPGLTWSNTTRRAGIVTNLDVASTVLDALGVHTAAGGAPIRAVPLQAAGRDVPYGASVEGDAWSYIEALYARTVATNSLRGPFVRGYVGFAIVVFLGWAAWLAGARAASARGPETAAPLWRWLLLLLSAAPLAALLLPLLPPSETTGSMALLLGIAAAVTMAFGLLFRRGADAFVAVSLATAALIFVDVSLGARLVKNSVLGYDPIVAARFYGIGNEYMGVFIGACLIGTSGVLDSWARLQPRRRGALLWTGIVYVGGIVLLASPTLGANVGGTVAAVAGFGSAAVLLSGRPLSWRRLTALGAVVAVVLAAAALADVTLNRQEPSHLGRTLQAFLTEGWAPIAAIAARKLAMNLTLLRWTIWSQVFVVSLAISTVALYRPGAAVRRADERHPFLLKGVRGALVGALAALVANDSGVVAAATLMIPVTSTLVYVMLLQRRPLTPGSSPP